MGVIFFYIWMSFELYAYCSALGIIYLGSRCFALWPGMRLKLAKLTLVFKLRMQLKIKTTHNFTDIP